LEDLSISSNESADFKERFRPTVLGIGGTLRPGSSSEKALRLALRAAETCGADTRMITARELNFPAYDPELSATDEIPAPLINAVRRADCLIVASPGYHGGMSGLLKNALDYLQALASDPSPYLHNKAVGCIVTAAGWQAGVTTLLSMRSTVHSLRGWPTPLGVVINSITQPFSPEGEVLEKNVGDQLNILAKQVVTFAQAHLGRSGRNEGFE
jgi:FMN reductase